MTENKSVTNCAKIYSITDDSHYRTNVEVELKLSVVL